MAYPYDNYLIVHQKNSCQNTCIKYILRTSRQTITNAIHTKTYVYVSRLSKVGVEVGVSAILLLSITMQMDLVPTGQLQTTSKPVTISLIFISFNNTKSLEATSVNLIVQRVAERCEKLQILYLTPVSRSIRKISNI